MWTFPKKGGGDNPVVHIVKIEFLMDSKNPRYIDEQRQKKSIVCKVCM